MNIQKPTSKNIDCNDDEEVFAIGDTAHYSLKSMTGVVQKVGGTYLLLEVFNRKKDTNEIANVPKNKCYLLEEAELEELEFETEEI
jgi:hypothetical protein